MCRPRSQLEPTLFLTILLRSSDEDDGFLSLGWHGDFDTFTLVREPGREAGGVAERPVVEPGAQRNHIRSEIRRRVRERGKCHIEGQGVEYSGV